MQDTGERDTQAAENSGENEDAARDNKAVPDRVGAGAGTLSDKKRPLTNKQKVFVSEYLQCWNAAESARRAGYSEKTAYSIGQENLRKPEIKEEIEARLAELHMSADEALKLQADIARGDIGDLLDNNGLLDIRLAKSSGKTRLLKKIKQKTVTRIGKSDDDDDLEITEIEFEMYPADAAQVNILKLHGKFTDKLEIQGGVEIITKRIGVDLSKV